MTAMIWGGAALAAIGLVGILACAMVVMKAKREGLEEAEMTAKLQKVIAWNMGAFMLSAFGLILTVVGIILG